MMDLFGLNGAEFSENREYRYALWRIWDETKPNVMIIGLNPSRADESVDDPTIRRVRQLAASWGFGGIYMLNLFAWITPYPKELSDCEDPTGDNETKLHKYFDQCEEVVFAWGSNETHGFEKQISSLFPNAKCIALNADGSPKHPLYIKKGAELMNYSQTQD